MQRVYLMSPYSHKDIKVCEERVKIADNASAFLMEQGYIVFSPLSHSHPISLSEYGKNVSSHLDHGFWLTQDFAWLQFCEGYFILKIEGWDKSTGVSVERALCDAIDDKEIPFLGYIHYDPDADIADAFKIEWELPKLPISFSAPDTSFPLFDGIQS
jgi:hypothetical protein